MNDSGGFIELRENLMTFYKKQEYLLQPVFRFALSLGLLLLLRGHLAVHAAGGAVLNSVLVNIILALVCSMVPYGAAAGIIALVMVWELYSLSLEAAGICAAILLLCILLYFRFAPRDVVILLLMPAAYALNLHYAVPVIAGLLFGPGAAVPVVFGLIFTRYVLLVEESLPEISRAAAGGGLTGADILNNFRGLIDGMMGNRQLIILAAAFALTALVVCFIRHLIIEHAWGTAIVAGFVLETAVLMAGDMKFGIHVDLVRLLIGIILSFILVQIVSFFAFNVDYLRVENVQFEDEDYYYYVKAVPKTIAPLYGIPADQSGMPSGSAGSAGDR